MKRLVAIAGGLLIVAGVGACPVAQANPAPVRQISVSGTDVGSYPDFDPSILRYGITTAADTNGQVTVDASTDDPSGAVSVDGRPSDGPAASVPVAGLVAGNEISIIITDSDGTTAYSLIYLPAGFPALTATTDQPGVATGDVFLTLTDWTGTTPSYEAIVDVNGVPVYVRDDGTHIPLDLAAQPNGHYSVFRPPAVSGQTGGQIVELNSRFRQVGSYATAGLSNTDGHDAILEPNGDRWFVAYQPNPDTGNTDAVIQEQDSAGAVLFQWNSANHVDLAKDGLGVPSGDYAHINSIELMVNGDLLASFRHLSQVMEIATHPHDGFQTGQVVWRLGGRRSSYTYVDDPDGGPCAQHAATEIGTDDIMVFDNGSPSLPNNPALCVDPADPTGPTAYRNHTRVAEYQLDPQAGTATLKWSYEMPSESTIFAGSAQRLGNGDTFVGWGGLQQTLATEVDDAGDAVWQLTNTAGLSSYRALKFTVPDTTKPVINLHTPADGASYALGQHVVADYSCVDTGGSNLQTCHGSDSIGHPLPTATPGTHRFTVTATDGADNTTTVTHVYRVVAPAVHRPDAAVRSLPNGKYVGRHVYGPLPQQEIRQSAKPHRPARAQVLLTNAGNRTEQLRVTGTAGTPRFGVAYRSAGADITSRVAGGHFLTPPLAPGASYRLTVIVAPKHRSEAGRTLLVRLHAAAKMDLSATDSVGTRVTARR